MRTSNLIRATLLSALLCTIFAAPVLAGVPAVEWQKLLGGSDWDIGYSAQQTVDGGYILLGRSSSNTSGDVTGTNHGTTDYWVVKLDETGAIAWQKLLGGNGNEEGFSVQQTSDGGYILAGFSSSSASGDVTGTNHGLYSWDVWVVKLDGAGAIQWQKLLGGSGYERSPRVRQTADGGYILLSTSDSSRSGDVTGTNHGLHDFWVAKLDGAGGIQWQKLLGGNANDYGESVHQTADGGYILTGYSYSSASGNVTGTNHGSGDLWAVKLDGAGTIQWQKLLGGSRFDGGYSVQQIGDGGYLLAGSSQSSASGNVTGTNHGHDDFWVVKLDGAGGIQWQELLGGGGNDYCHSIQQTSDGGYVLLGDSDSSADGDVTGTNHGDGDFWVVRLASTGTIRWQVLLGGDGGESGSSVRQTADGGYVLFGFTDSSESGDVAGATHGSYDYWVVKLEGDVPIVAVPGGVGAPRDLNADGKYDDVNGNGRKDFADVVLYFNQMTWIAANEPVTAFDFNGNGRIDFADVVWLFNNL
jgi:hypothetical protein